MNNNQEKIRETVLPTEEELKEFGLSLRNGVDLRLSDKEHGREFRDILLPFRH